MLLLCGFFVFLSLLQDTTAYKKCSSAAYYNTDAMDHPLRSRFSTCELQHDTFEPWRAVVYILIDLAPLVIYLPLLILFNVNFAAGPGQSFVFFYQSLPSVIPADSIFRNHSGIISEFSWGLLTMQSPINNLLGSYVIDRDYRLSLHTLPYIALQYCKLALVLVAVVTAVVLVKCIHCPCAPGRQPWAKLRRFVRHFRERYALKGTVLNGLCSIAVLTYGFVIQQSFSILQPAKCCSNDTRPYADQADSNTQYCAFYCTEMEYFSTDHLPYFFVAVLTLLIVLPLPLLLLYYPAVPAAVRCITKRPSPITCHKLAPVFDVFQSAYKPKLRFFAAFPLLYRIAVWVIFSLLSPIVKRRNRGYFITVAYIVILAIHSLVQPYKKPKHNYIEALYLVNLVMISITHPSVFDLAAPERGSHDDIVVLGALGTGLAFLPIVVGASYFLWRCKCSKRCRAAISRKFERIEADSVEEGAQAPAAQVPPTVVYIDMSEVERLTQD